MSTPQITCAVCQQPFAAVLTKCPNCQPSPRGTVPAVRGMNSEWTFKPFRIIIDEIPHSDQRYNTCGDYFEAEDASVVINVSQLVDRREMALIAIHELVEWALCQAAGVTNKSIDDFDCCYPDGAELPHPVEPGDHPDAPYYRQHQFATGIERILAAELGVDWLTYERHIEELGK
jgi:hypothetical protein